MPSPKSKVLIITFSLVILVSIFLFSLLPSEQKSDGEDDYYHDAFGYVNKKRNNNHDDDVDDINKLRQKHQRQKSSADGGNGTERVRDIAGKCYKGGKQWWKPARCPPDEWWLEPWVKIENGKNKNNNTNTNNNNNNNKRKHWTMVDVGANKGYTLTSWTELLFGANRTKFTAHNLGKALFNKSKQFTTMSHCGGCCECAQPPAVLEDEFATKKKDVNIIAFEPGPATARHLKEFFVGDNDDDHDDEVVAHGDNNNPLVDIRWKAVADKAGKALFPDVPIGKETGRLVAVGDENNNNNNNNTHNANSSSINSNGGPKMVELDVVTLDEELKKMYQGDDAPGIDVLTTDVEGLDQDVAKGARNLLSSGKVGVYIFEMNRLENYTKVFSWLHDVGGFECYFGTERRFVKSPNSGARTSRKIPPVIRITGPCWKSEYEGYSGWINAICVHKKRARDVIKIMGDLTRKSWKIKMACSGRKDQQRVVGNFLRRNLWKEIEEWNTNKNKK